MSSPEETYQTFKMQDFERSGDSLLAEVNYLEGMFDLETRNQKDVPIVITLREKPAHFMQRRQADKHQP